MVQHTSLFEAFSFWKKGLKVKSNPATSRELKSRLAQSQTLAFDRPKTLHQGAMTKASRSFSGVVCGKAARCSSVPVMDVTRPSWQTLVTSLANVCWTILGITHSTLIILVIACEDCPESRHEEAVQNDRNLIGMDISHQ